MEPMTVYVHQFLMPRHIQVDARMLCEEFSQHRCEGYYVSLS